MRSFHCIDSESLIFVRPGVYSAGANAAISKLPKVSGSNAQPAMAASLQKILDRASKEADSFKDDFISTEHLLLAHTEA